MLLHPSGAMELRFTKPSFKYKAGQWLFLNVPRFSKFQWHPVSDATASRLTLVHHIVRSRGPSFLSVHIVRSEISPKPLERVLARRWLRRACRV